LRLGRLDDDRLVEAARRGEEAAFEAMYDRYHRRLLAFCRHMLGSREDSEDALQHTFAAAFREVGGSDGELKLKRLLYTIARNRCIDILRARREQPTEDMEEQTSTAGLSDEVEQRAELRHLLSDLKELPDKQRAALLLFEVGDLAHAEIAQVLGCEAQQVKAYVFQARCALIQSREARETPCEEIRERVSTATKAELRKPLLKRHLRQCEGCRQFSEQVRRQRQMLAVLLPVAPSLGLKRGALAAAGVGSGSGGGGGGGALLASLGASAPLKALTAGLAALGVAGSMAALGTGFLAPQTGGVERASDSLGLHRLARSRRARERRIFMIRRAMPAGSAIRRPPTSHARAQRMADRTSVATPDRVTHPRRGTARTGSRDGSPTSRAEPGPQGRDSPQLADSARSAGSRTLWLRAGKPP
jgi:RNA polymerase sigma factor (sigma-70 family)